MKPLAFAYILAVAATVLIVGGFATSHGSGTGLRNPAEVIQGRCASLHFEYDRVRCVAILTEQMSYTTKPTGD